MNAFQPSLPGFEGQLADLVQAVQQRRLDVTDLPLADLTAQFSGYLEQQSSLDLTEVGEFARQAATLLALKSARLLPGAEIPDWEEEESAEHRPPPVPGLESVRTLLGERQGLEMLPPPPRISSVERPTAPVSPTLLVRAWHGMRERREGVLARVSAAPAFLKLEVALSGLIRTLRSARRVAFSRLTRGVSRHDAAVHFLAVLELVRRRQIVVEQATLFGEIEMEWSEVGRSDVMEDRAG